MNRLQWNNVSWTDPVTCSGEELVTGFVSTVMYLASFSSKFINYRWLTLMKEV